MILVEYYILWWLKTSQKETGIAVCKCVNHIMICHIVIFVMKINNENLKLKVL